jgi:hypothetical protein
MSFTAFGLLGAHGLLSVQPVILTEINDLQLNCPESEANELLSCQFAGTC